MIMKTVLNYQTSYSFRKWQAMERGEGDKNRPTLRLNMREIPSIEIFSLLGSSLHLNDLSQIFAQPGRLCHTDNLMTAQIDNSEKPQRPNTGLTRN